jgi:hypothetical protein
MLVALFFCSDWRASENSDSVARVGTTDTITSEAKCATRATITYQVSTLPCRKVGNGVRCSQCRDQDNDVWRGIACAGNIPASPAVLMELMVTANWWRRTVEEQSSLERRQDGVITTRVVGDRPHHITGSGNGRWDNFSQRDVTMPAPNCVIDASAVSGSGEEPQRTSGCASNSH